MTSKNIETVQKMKFNLGIRSIGLTRHMKNKMKTGNEK